MSGFDIVYVSAVPWTLQRQRPHAIALELARRYRVLYVDSVVRSLPGLVRDAWKSGWPQVRPGIQEIASNLTLFRPWPLLPGGCARESANHLNATFTARQISRLLDEPAGNFLLWLATPWAAALIPELHPSSVCYDCMDLIPAFYSGSVRALVERLESRVLRVSDFVFASSQLLYDHCRGSNDNVHLVRNGVWLEQYEAELEVPADLRSLPRPLLGYVGTIGPWIDWNLVAAVADFWANATVVLVGPMDEPGRLHSLPSNVVWLGSKPQPEVAAYVQAFDVCLIPFVQDELSAAVNPVKFYEYCAAGKPTLSVPLPELQRYGNLCHLGATADEWVRATRLALAQAGDYERERELAAGRRRVAADNSWHAQGDRILHIIGNAHRGAGIPVEMHNDV